MDINKKVCLNNVVPSVETDRISSLPDAILEHILSYLEIERAVQTCVLSRRWLHVWSSIPCLNFKFETFRDTPAKLTDERRACFENLIHQVLSRRCSSDIKKFSLFSNTLVGSSHLKSVVNYVLLCNVQIVEITYSNKHYRGQRNRRFIFAFEILDRMCTSQSLRVLKLTACDDGSITLPRTLSFTALKELHLDSIALWDKSYEWSNITDRELISNCPNLEYLTLVSCEFGKFRSLKITAPQLTKLEILFLEGAASPEKCNVIVSAPKLFYFKYDCHAPLVCSMGNPLDINTVDIDIREVYKKKKKKKMKIAKEYEEEIACQLIAMLQEFQHAKSVTLSVKALKILSKVPRTLHSQPSPFCNLKNFKTNLRGSPFFHGLNYILQDSPHAESTLKGSSFW